MNNTLQVLVGSRDPEIVTVPLQWDIWTFVFWSFNDADISSIPISLYVYQPTISQMIYNTTNADTTNPNLWDSAAFYFGGNPNTIAYGLDGLFRNLVFYPNYSNLNDANLIINLFSHNFPAETPFLAHYPLNSNGGTVLVDISGNQNDGSLRKHTFFSQ